MAVLADDDVVVHRDAERLGDGDDCFCHRDIGLRRRWIAGGVVVHQYSLRRYRIEPKGIFAESRNRWGIGLGPVVCDATCSSSSTTSSHAVNSQSTFSHR